MDDCLKSVSSEQEALQMVRDLTTACAMGGFRLSKSMSSSRTVIASIPEENRAASKELNLEKDKLPVERALVNANSACRKIIADCLYLPSSSRVGEKKMSDLPVERILPDLPPFTNVGVDYFAPIEIKRGRNLVKRYG